MLWAERLPRGFGQALEVSMLPNEAVGLLYIRVPSCWVPVSKLLIWKDFYNWHKRCLELSVPKGLLTSPLL